MKPYYTLLLMIAVLSALPNIPALAQENSKTPIGAHGHGAFFDDSGKQIPITLDFVESAQLWYRDALLGQMPDEKREAYQALEKTALDGLSDRQEAMILRHQLLENMILETDTAAKPTDTVVKLKTLRYEMNWALPQTTSLKVPRLKPEFKLSEALMERLRKYKSKKDVLDGELDFTMNSGQAYIDECRSAGVPIPPPINQMDATGLAGWRSEGFIPQSLQFIVGTPAELRSFRSVIPEGMCYALPRYTDATRTRVRLDGVICLGKQSSKVCIWDNQKTDPVTGVVSGFEFGASEIIPIGVPSVAGGKYQAGGAEIEFGTGGTCTDCHAGENPYIVHPEATIRLSPMGMPVKWQKLHQRVGGGDLPSFSVNRYIPLVGASWPQNASSLTAAATPGACVGCHVKTGAGRLPHLSNQLPDYCDTILPAAGAATMPQFSPGSAIDDVDSLISSYCNAAPNASVEDVGDPHITTVDGTRFDFQAAGEFTMLKTSDDYFEIQTRQSPVLVNFVPGANPHTGLASCPSLNTAVGVRVGKAVVSYQPKGGALSSRESLELYLDGAVVAAGVYDLGDGNTLIYSGAGDAVEIQIQKETRVRVVPRFWASQSYWYLDLYVDNTPAREGVMGLVTAGDWLPRAPDSSSFGPRPLLLADRHETLNKIFADAWRVSSASSLFYYASGTSTWDFTDQDWPAPPGGSCEKTTIRADLPKVDKPALELARKLCSSIKNEAIRASCTIDVTVMGEAQAAEVHLKADAAN